MSWKFAPENKPTTTGRYWCVYVCVYPFVRPAIWDGQIWKLDGEEATPFYYWDELLPFYDPIDAKMKTAIKSHISAITG